MSAADRIGPGRLILVAGPSGAGKDSVIGFARAALGADRHVHFPLRVVTRPSDATETVVPMPPEAFAAAEAAGDFALTWRAHGLAYALPATIDARLAAGDTVVANVSRSVVAEARQRYRDVALVLIDAPAEIRAARLGGRGREAGADVAARLGRRVEAGLIPDLVIVNDGTLAAAGARLVAFIRQGRVVPPSSAPCAE